MSKILFVVKCLGITVLDNQYWLNGNVLIKDMSEDHLHNSILWVWKRHQAELGANVQHQKLQGLTANEWFHILKGEKARRERLAIDTRIAELEKLQFELLPQKQQRKVKLQKIEEELELLRPDAFR